MTDIINEDKQLRIARSLLGSHFGVANVFNLKAVLERLSKIRLIFSIKLVQNVILLTSYVI